MSRRRSDKPDRRHLEAFLAVIDHGGFAAAGRDLGISQSAVSQSLRQLEIIVGTELFVRSARPFTLTATGRAAEPHARRSIQDFDSFVSVAVRESGSISGRLNICTIPTMSAQPIAKLVGAFRQAYPRVRVDITQPASRSIADVSHAVRHGLADVGITEFPTEARGLKTFEFNRQVFVAALPPHAQQEGVAIDTGTFTSYGLIVGPYFETSVAYAQLKKLDPDIDSHITIRTDHRESFQHLVAAGLGATLLHSDRSSASRQLGCKIFQFKPVLSRRAGLVFPREYLSPAAEAFVRVCQESSHRSGPRP